MKPIIKEEDCQAMTIEKLWEAIGRAYGASDEQVADLVEKMTKTNEREIKEENQNGL